VKLPLLQQEEVLKCITCWVTIVGLGTTSLKLHSKEAGVNNKKFWMTAVNGVFGWQVQDDLKEGIDRGVKELPAFLLITSLLPVNRHLPILVQLLRRH
jgi:hypothetical protein